MATLITCFRILASASLLLCQPLSPAFYVLYIAAGISDMIDGPVARRTGTAGDFGAKLDTAADFSFMAVCLYKLLPVLDVPLWLWVWIALIALAKTVNVVSGFVIQKRFVTLHTTMPPSPPFRKAASYAWDAGNRRIVIYRTAVRARTRRSR